MEYDHIPNIDKKDNYPKLPTISNKNLKDQFNE